MESFHPRDDSTHTRHDLARYSSLPCQPDRAGDAMVVGLVVDGAKEGILVGLLGKARQELTDLNAGDVGAGSVEWPFVIRWGIRLWVKRVQVARPAPEPD